MFNFKAIKNGNENKNIVEIYLFEIPEAFQKSGNRQVLVLDKESLSTAIAHEKDGGKKVEFVAFSFTGVAASLAATTTYYANATRGVDLDTGDIIECDVHDDIFGKLNYLSSWRDVINKKELMELMCKEVTKNLYVEYSLEEAVKIVAEKAGIPEFDVEREIKNNYDLVSKIVERTTKLKCAHNKLYHDSLSSDTDATGLIFNSLPGVTVLRGGTGLGKTELAKTHREKYERKGFKTMQISNQTAVVQQYTGKHNNAALYNDGLHVIENAMHLATTLKSMYKMHVRKFASESKLFIFDEIETMFQALLKPNDPDDSNEYISKQHKKLILKVIKDIFSMPNVKIILMDADVSDDVTVKVAKSMSKKKRFHVHELHNDVYSNIKVSIVAQSILIPKLIKDKLVSNKPMYICTDSKTQINTLLEQAGYKTQQGDACYEQALAAGILILHANSKGGDEQKAFLDDPDSEILRYKTVLVSPCLKEGFSIVAKHAEQVIVLANCVLLPLELIQMARRLRTATSIVFAVKPNFNQPIYGDYYRNVSTVEDEVTAELQTRADVLLQNLPVALEKTLHAVGFDVVEYGQKEELIKIAEQIKQEQAIDPAEKTKDMAVRISDSKNLTRKEKEALDDNNLTVAQQLAVRKVEIAGKLGTEPKEVTSKAVEFSWVFHKGLAKTIRGQILGETNHPDIVLVNSAGAVINSYGLRTLDHNTTITLTDPVAVYNALLANRDAINDSLDLKYVKYRLPKQAKPLSERSRIKAQRYIRDLLSVIGFETDHKDRVTVNGKKCYVAKPSRWLLSALGISTTTRRDC